MTGLLDANHSFLPNKMCATVDTGDSTEHHLILDLPEGDREALTALIRSGTFEDENVLRLVNAVMQATYDRCKHHCKVGTLK